jgi:alanyl-tRNA synthetase
VDGREIRETFLAYFEQRGHKRVASSSLIPDDPSLLLTTAGMVQFKPYFLGLVEPPFTRATSVQKSFRTTDIDNVGHTARHLTLFEMLGNFSFGDYFKEESLAWGFDLVTNGYGIDPELLWATAYEDDDESVEIWRSLGLPDERIAKRGKADNFWSMGVAGPCGPCSEIFVDRGSQHGADGGPDADEDRYMEIWNHVFMQFVCDDDIKMVGDLERRGVDTGSSVERLAVVLQGADSVFDTDLLRPMMEIAQEMSGNRYGADEAVDVSLRILAEHGRATTFLIADGVLPSNEGRGYVLRRMLRRVVSHARRLGIDVDIVPRLAQATVDSLGDVYPELRENEAYTLRVAASEEERFAGTLRQGMTLFTDYFSSEMRQHVSGEVAFKLYDTYGFPVEVTQEMASEIGVDVDMARFEELMREQRERASKAARKVGLAEESLTEAVSRSGASEFVGYDTLSRESRIGSMLTSSGVSDIAQEGDEVRLILDVTPFYPEGGGQVGDRGIIRTSSGLVRVTDTQRAPGDAIVHTGVVEAGEIRVDENAWAEVDAELRASTARSHTATHIVHWTLRQLLGEHARQAGSLVAPGRLRFDFTHHSAVPLDMLEEAEYTANRRLAEDAPVRAVETSMEEAKARGAMALFGEKYGDVVRMVEIGDYSRELCGGTHVATTGNVAVVRILGEGSIGSGMRRVEAVVGLDALKQVNAERRLLDEIVAELGGGDPGTAPERIRKLLERQKRSESELGKMRKGELDQVARSFAQGATTVDGVSLVLAEHDAAADGLRELAQKILGLLEGGAGRAVVLGNGSGGKAMLVAACDNQLIQRDVTAPKLLERAAKMIGGGAGGKPGLAFAGGGKADGFAQALSSVPARLAELLPGA